MDPDKEDELVDSITQPTLEVYNLVMKRMAVDVSVQHIGYRLSDQKEPVWTRINHFDDFPMLLKYRQQRQWDM